MTTQQITLGRDVVERTITALQTEDGFQMEAAIAELRAALAQPEQPEQAKQRQEAVARSCKTCKHNDKSFCTAEGNCDGVSLWESVQPPPPAPQAGSWREDYPTSQVELGAELSKAKADEAFYGVGFLVNGWHVPAHVVSVWGLTKPASIQPETQPSPDDHPVMHSIPAIPRDPDMEPGE